ncbi:hypothetical protein [Pedobacter flavus]|uniref:Uncharacterized protein n=1 Tax=Pedobacter flavus TaxID=3113906 RepID=A0ABU7H241_9SPHI|nr:hypothetical protein [Pedobacter sp. VNH31]MEE1885220.1 hypothetical protein [Pedobacter sp. VNH31]
MKNLLLLLIFFSSFGSAFSQNTAINNFIIKENLLKNNKIAVIAVDSLNVPNEEINGLYTFSFSGFTESLNFNNGVAVVPLKIEKSTFIYVKHENESGTHSKLVYVYKKNNDLTPFSVNGWWLFIIPLIIIILAFMFRKLIIFAAILLIVYFYFNFSNGLSLGTLFETFFDGLKNLFN